jgi:predicted DNA-binding protein with PD1-like motif
VANLGLSHEATCGRHLFEMTVRPTVKLVFMAYAKLVGRNIDPEWSLLLPDP